MSDESRPKPRCVKALLLGLGLDHTDGHVRVTRGRNFRLLGGSQETHEAMQEKAIKFNEHLDKRRKRLEDITPQEFREIAGELDLRPAEE
jgi:hypothetical protein